WCFLNTRSIIKEYYPLSLYGPEIVPLQIEYPENVHLFRGNHEAADINALFGFRLECIERMGESDGIWAWTRFNHLPLAALIENKIICMHGLRPNARGSGLVTFGPDRVTEFCKKNKLQPNIRAHECVMDELDRFAQGQLITLFSATNYCGMANNAGAILVVGRGLVIVPKLIHPLPPPILSPEHSGDDAWMQDMYSSGTRRETFSYHELNIQRPPTPTRDDEVL
ncbi:hypothetical protein HID58_053023, partial [Brassica napus]